MLQNLWTRSVLAVSQARERDEGQTLVEYALIIALVSVALIAALGAVTGSIEGVFSDIKSALDGAI